MKFREKFILSLIAIAAGFLGIFLIFQNKIDLSNVVENDKEDTQVQEVFEPKLNENISINSIKGISESRDAEVDWGNNIKNSYIRSIGIEAPLVSINSGNMQIIGEYLGGENLNVIYYLPSDAEQVIYYEDKSLSYIEKNEDRVILHLLKPGEEFEIEIFNSNDLTFESYIYDLSYKLFYFTYKSEDSFIIDILYLDGTTEKFFSSQAFKNLRSELTGSTKDKVFMKFNSDCYFISLISKDLKEQECTDQELDLNGYYYKKAENTLVRVTSSEQKTIVNLNAERQYLDFYVTPTKIFFIANDITNYIFGEFDIVANTSRDIFKTPEYSNVKDFFEYKGNYYFITNDAVPKFLLVNIGETVTTKELKFGVEEIYSLKIFNQASEIF